LHAFNKIFKIFELKDNLLTIVPLLKISFCSYATSIRFAAAQAKSFSISKAVNMFFNKYFQFVSELAFILDKFSG